MIKTYKDHDVIDVYEVSSEDMYFLIKTDSIWNKVALFVNPKNEGVRIAHFSKTRLKELIELLKELEEALPS